MGYNLYMRQLTKVEKLLHKIEMKLLHWTSYEQKSMTIKRLLKDIYLSRIIKPFKSRGLFGYCDICSKFNFGLVRDVVDVDMDQDEDGWHTFGVYGMVCQECYLRREYGEVGY